MPEFTFIADLPTRYPLAYQIVAPVLLLALAWLVHLLVRRLIVASIDRFIRASSATWDDALHQAKVFHRLALLVPIFVVWYGASLMPELDDDVLALLQRVAMASIALVAARVVGGLLTAVNVIYSADPEVGRRSIKGYLQVVEIAVYIVAAILILASLMDRSPLVFLGGLGAMTAVLLIVFKDTLLGLVASVQIASNDMVRVGDWIEMPQSGADGDVIDIALHTLKVQNWDKTITTVPTHRLIQESFKNWRGMSQAGARRIKRALYFDLNTVRFLTDDEVDRFSDYSLLREYIAAKRGELAEWNAQPGRDAAISADIRKLTNIGTLRAYIECYLKNHPDIHQGMTLLVRQLQSTPDGLPIEIYCFTNTTDWGLYEGIQSDLFDHILAVTPEFGLRIFQNESDFRQGTPGQVAGGRPPVLPLPPAG